MVRRNLDNFDLEEEKDHFELPCTFYFPNLIIYADGLFLYGVISFLCMDFSSASSVLLYYTNGCFIGIETWYGLNFCYACSSQLTSNLE